MPRLLRDMDCGFGEKDPYPPRWIESSKGNEVTRGDVEDRIGAPQIRRGQERIWICAWEVRPSHSGQVLFGDACNGLKFDAESCSEQKEFAHHASENGERYFTESRICVEEETEAAYQKMSQATKASMQRSADLQRNEPNRRMSGGGDRQIRKKQRIIARATGRTREASGVYILADSKGRPLTYWALRRRFDAAREAAGKENAELAAWQFRDLRAKTASDSESLDAAQSRLGHTSSSTTRRVYRRGEKVRPLR